ncbi:STAS domain-containing protein [Dactylosporangium salmoneum]|uniref:Anti-sigma factor antagonist n=1 Tax=Dactylosporangium salmoneum TaxID=53361 RepID=A0ABN3FPC2_9ACTN
MGAPDDEPLLAMTTARGPGEVVTLVLAGEIDRSTAEQVVAAGTTVVAGNRNPRLVIDMAQVRFMDSTGVHALVRLQRLGREAGVGVEVVNPSAVVARVLTVTGVFHVLVGAG